MHSGIQWHQVIKQTITKKLYQTIHIYILLLLPCLKYQTCLWKATKRSKRVCTTSEDLSCMSWCLKLIVKYCSGLVCIYIVSLLHLATLHIFSITYIQVEHLIREEKMVAAYELIEIYCELIAARLPIIESQKYVHYYLKGYLHPFFPNPAWAWSFI